MAGSRHLPFGHSLFALLSGAADEKPFANPSG
jgi:hypothetical protein